jgi:aspartyl-tRNA(Asn)/glutamyl-tRNA(Gln) amidotransferase subunit B
MVTAMTKATETFESVIGLEVHVQLATASKLFCACSTRFGAEPNTQICPICLGHPGVLPVLNARAVELASRLALAVGGELRHESVFARKNYFYPDLPKGYQISQYELPIAEGGEIRFRSAGEERVVRLVRVHLEEDAGKLLHEGSGDSSLVDCNRAGVPLLEVVSQPELREPHDAYLYLQRLRQLVRWLGVSDGNMEEGSLRCDANVSIRRRGTQALGVRVEVKNLNSFRNVERSLAFEIARQSALVQGGGVVDQETRLWDADRERTAVLRSKEEAHDYRYFPDPDLYPLRLDPAAIARIRAALPELPHAREARYMTALGLPEYDAVALAETLELGDYFEAAAAPLADPKRAANWILTEVLGIVNERKIGIADFPVPAVELAALLKLVKQDTLSGKQAKDVFQEMVATGQQAAAIVAARGLGLLSDEEAIAEHVRAVVQDHPEPLAQYLAGKEAAFKFFMGELMKRTRGRVPPATGQALLKAELERRRSG